MALPDSIAAYPRLLEAEELLKARSFDAASAKVIEHLREHRDEPRGLALLGEIAMGTGALLQSERFLRGAIARGNSSYEVQKKLATNILRQDRLDEALEAFTRLELQSDDPQPSASRALILDRLGRTEEALQAHEKLLSSVPEDPRYWVNYGQSLRFAGRTDDAIAAYRKAIAIDPERGDAWWSLADIKSRVLTDEDMATMEKELAAAVDIVNISPLHMALGRGLHDRGEYARAFEHYRESNRLRSELLNYEPDQLSLEVDQFIKMVSPASFAAPAKGQWPIPIFLVSLPRAGSTLLEQILGRHPLIEAVGELPYIRSLVRAAMEMRMTRGAIDAPTFVATLTPDDKRMLGAEYLRRAAQHRQSDSPYFIDKMPMNWMDTLFIREILPQARFVEIRRNAMECCFSNYTHHFASAHPSSFDLVHQALCYRDYARLMDHIKDVAPEFLASVRYETLIDDPEPVLRGVLDYLGLEWDESLLRFYESDRTVRTPSAEQVRRPLNRAGIGTWKPYEQWLGPLKEALGPLLECEIA
jgi:tetratricopeptide (TPR) repeat protein